ncbi:MAG: M20/M25/M40 family metallo-hydrolase [Halobacteriales archaeon]
MYQSLFDHIDANADAYREDLFELLRQPSISTQGVGVETCADLLIETMGEYGFDARRIETSTFPLVYAEEIVDPDAPTVLFYGHYDVQPPGDESEWESPAFEPTIRNDSIYARGAGDNKGQLTAHVFGADAVRSVRGELPVNVKFLFEGEEESGSAGLIEFVEDDPAELDADLIYVADGPMHPSRRPTLMYGNRGILSVELTLQTANSDLHSGNFGGPVPNAANELVEVLDTMYDGDTVTIDGFHDDVAITDAQRRAARELPIDGDSIKADLDLTHLNVPEERYYERLLLEPTLTINGLTSGYQQEGMKTIIPHTATAKLDMRLVPEQDPDAVFERVRDHVADVHPDVDVEKQGTFPPMSTPLDTPAADDVLGALEAAWEREPVEMPMIGGSLPAAYFRRGVDVPILVVPYANPDQGNHSPNEHLDVHCFENGIRVSAGFIDRFGQ